ncbi:unnamed protein product [Prunus brigantina]
MLQLSELGGGCAMKFGLPAPHPLWFLCCKLTDFLAPRGASASVLEADGLPFWRRHSYWSLAFVFLAVVRFVKPCLQSFDPAWAVDVYICIIRPLRKTGLLWILESLRLEGEYGLELS